MPAELRSHSEGHEGRTLVLTLHHPEQRNALSPGICAAGVEALNGAESSRELRCIVITGSGAHFSAGHPPAPLPPHDPAAREEALALQIERLDALHSWIDAIRTFPKPVIAAVEGTAAGAGFALALACDFVVAARDAAFCAAEGGEAGAPPLSPHGGLSWHIARALPRPLASEWLMQNQRLTAERLHTAGLVNTLCDSGRALGSALHLADTLAEHPPAALASTKDLLAEAPHATLDAHLALEREHFVRQLHPLKAGGGR